MEEERRGMCCHEAGHAVARVLNGDALLLLISDPNAVMTKEQRAVYCSGTRVNGEGGGAR